MIKNAVKVVICWQAEIFNFDCVIIDFNVNVGTYKLRIGWIKLSWQVLNLGCFKTNFVPGALQL